MQIRTPTQVTSVSFFLSAAEPNTLPAPPSSKVASASADRISSDDLRKWLEGLNDEDLGRYKM